MSGSERSASNFAARLRTLRFRRLGLSQDAFAERFGLSAGMIRDVEQGRVQPSRAFRVLLELIDEDPRKATEAAYRERCGDSEVSRTTLKGQNDD